MQDITPNATVHPAVRRRRCVISAAQLSRQILPKHLRQIVSKTTAKDEKQLLRYQKQMATHELLIVDELGFVPLSKTGAELLFEGLWCKIAEC